MFFSPRRPPSRRHSAATLRSVCVCGGGVAAQKRERAPLSAPRALPRAPRGFSRRKRKRIPETRTSLYFVCVLHIEAPSALRAAHGASTALRAAHGASTALRAAPGPQMLLLESSLFESALTLALGTPLAEGRPSLRLEMQFTKPFDDFLEWLALRDFDQKIAPSLNVLFTKPLTLVRAEDLRRVLEPRLVADHALPCLRQIPGVGGVGFGDVFRVRAFEKACSQSWIESTLHIRGHSLSDAQPPPRERVVLLFRHTTAPWRALHVCACLPLALPIRCE